MVAQRAARMGAQVAQIGAGRVVEAVALEPVVEQALPVAEDLGDGRIGRVAVGRYLVAHVLGPAGRSAVVPFADNPRHVAVGVEHLGEGHRVGGNVGVPLDIGLALGRGGVEEVARPGAAGVGAGEAGVAAGRADAAGRIGPRQVHALGGEAVDVGREGLPAEESERVEVLVVGDDEEDVGRAIIGGARDRGRQESLGGAEAGGGAEGSPQE